MECIWNCLLSQPTLHIAMLWGSHLGTSFLKSFIILLRAYYHFKVPTDLLEFLSIYMSNQTKRAKYSSMSNRIFVYRHL